MPHYSRPLVVALLSVLLMGQASPAGASIYPLEVTNIRSDLGPNNRWTRAFPGIEYNVRPAVIGGHYPYTFALANAPAGMAINPLTGEISWPNPTAGASASPTLTVLDTQQNKVSVTWTIKVTSEGFRFVDATRGRQARGNGCTTGCAAGTAEDPWRSIQDVLTAGRAGEFVYFKAGTYSIAELPRVKVGTGWDRVEFIESAKPVVWLAYPEHQPVIDFAYRAGVDDGALIRFRGDNVYVDGFETTNARLIGFQFEPVKGIGPTFRRLKMHNLGPGIDGSNSAFILTLTTVTPSNYMVIQDSEFFQQSGEGVTIKIYAQQKLLIEDTYHHHAVVGIELKDDVRQFTVRDNRFDTIQRVAIGGNMHELTTHGEILFNNSRAGVALDLNQDGMAKRIDVYRNTFVGKVQVRNTDSADGPFFLKNNVIVSSDVGNRGTRVSFSGVVDQSRIEAVDNLVGGPGERIVDETGNLTGVHVRSVGKFGHQLLPPGPNSRQ